jgi:hypothetical protein
MEPNDKGRRRSKLLNTGAVKLQKPQIRIILLIFCHIVSGCTILNLESSTNLFLRVIYVWVEVKICTYGLQPQPQPSSKSLDLHSIVRHWVLIQVTVTEGIFTFTVASKDEHTRFIFLWTSAHWEFTMSEHTECYTLQMRGNNAINTANKLSKTWKCLQLTVTWTKVPWNLLRQTR